MKPRTHAIHGGFSGDPETGAGSVPIYYTAAYTYPTAEGLADVFAGRALGDVYSRISNPTTQVLEQRLTALESGVDGPATGCIATSSGMAAITTALTGLLRAGDGILSTPGIFGGTVSLFTNTLSRFGIETTFADPDDATGFAAALRANTKVIFAESISNPGMAVADIPALSRLARERNIPLVVDNTLTPLPLLRAGALGADLVVHSTTKYINGHGTAIGGAIIDTGNYDWKNGAFPDLSQLARRAGQMAFLAHLRKTIYRDLGGCPAPMNSFLILQGLETLDIRMRLHCANAQRLATHLRSHPMVHWVNYPGLSDSAYRKRTDELLAGLGGGVLTFGLDSKEAARRFINALTLAKNMTNLGEAKTLVLHPASTIFQEYTPAEREQMGVPEDMLRVSVGIDDVDDIIEDFEQAMTKAGATSEGLDLKAK